MNTPNSIKRLASSLLPAQVVNAGKAARASLSRDRQLRDHHRANAAKIDELLRNNQPLRLELGAGGRRLNGWTSIDFIKGNDLVLDLSKPLPFPENCVDCIYSSHTFEHFWYPHPMNDLLKECLRVLKPGGWIKIVVPNASIYLKGYLGDPGFDADEWCVYKPALHGLSKIDCVNYMAYMNREHRHMFDEENLVAILQRAGFSEVGQQPFDPEIDLLERNFESLYVGGIKQKQ